MAINIFFDLQPPKYINCMVSILTIKGLQRTKRFPKKNAKIFICISQTFWYIPRERFLDPPPRAPQRAPINFVHGSYACVRHGYNLIINWPCDAALGPESVWTNLKLWPQRSAPWPVIRSALPRKCLNLT